MPSKRKDEPNQPALPARGMKPAAGPERVSPVGKGVPVPPARTAEPATDVNGEAHVQAEDVPAEVVHRPFAPGQIDLDLHRRVNTNFLEYASYVIRDPAIPNVED